MGYGNKFFQTTDFDETQMSKFNSAALKMSRLDILQKKLLLANLNFEGFDQEGIPNYLVIKKSCDILFLETYSNLNVDGQAEGELMKTKVEIFIEKYPPFSSVNGKTRVNNLNLKYIKKLLFNYEKLVRGFVSKTGMDTPTWDDDGL